MSTIAKTTTIWPQSTLVADMMIKGQASLALRASAASRRAYVRRPRAMIRSDAGSMPSMVCYRRQLGKHLRFGGISQLVQVIGRRMTTHHALGHAAAVHRRSTGHHRPQHLFPALAKPAEVGETAAWCHSTVSPSTRRNWFALSDDRLRSVPSRNLGRVQGRR